MSAQGVADRTSERISGGQYEFMLTNFANPFVDLPSLFQCAHANCW